MRSASTLLLALLPALAAAQQFLPLTGAELERIGVRTAVVAPASAGPAVFGQAEIQPTPEGHRAVTLTVDGVVEARLAGIGDTVQAGQPLLELASPEALDLQSTYLDALDAAALARAERERLTLLLADGLVAEPRARAAGAAAERAARAVARSAAALRTMGVDPEQVARSGMSEPALVVRAPIAGSLTVLEGDPGETLARADVVAEVVQFDRLIATIRLPQHAAEAVGEGQAVRLDDGGGSGRVLAVNRAVDPEQQTVLVRALIDAPSPDLRIGQRIGARILAPPGEDLREVPAGTVVSVAGQSGVFVVEAGGVRFEPVSAPAGRQGMQVFTGGPEPGTTVAVTGTAALKARFDAGEGP